MRDTAPDTAIETIGAELGKLEKELGALGFGNERAGEADRLYGQISDRWDLLARERPRNAREALVTAAVAFGRVHDTDQLGGYQHVLAHKMVARLLDWLEAEAGVTAAALGLGSYADGRDEAPAFGKDDEGTREFMRHCHDAGYLAAVARFARSAYPYVKAELERERAHRRVCPV